MNQPKRKYENEKSKNNKKKAPTKISEVPYSYNCRLCKEKETYTSRKVDDKLAIFLTKQNTSKIEKVSKNSKEEKTVPKKVKKSKKTKKTNHVPDAPVCSTSPALSDKTSDSDLIIISEADSGLSEKISPSSDYSSSSLCNDYTSELPYSNDLLSSDVRTESVSVPHKSKCNISVTLNDCGLNTSENDKILPYESAFAATLPHLEVNYESDFSDFMESGRTQDAVKDNSHLGTDSSIPNESILINRYREIMPEHYNSLQDITIPNYLSPKKSFLSLINNVNSVCDTKENIICNQLGIKPLIKPPDFSYKENNFFDFAVDIAMLRAASNYIKERSKSQIVLSSLPDSSGSQWNNSILKFSDPVLNLSGNCLNQFSSEDNESEISISSCRTSDIQPEFFDLTFSENFAENLSGENASHFDSIASPKANTHDLHCISSSEQLTDKIELSDTNNAKSLSETKPRVKRKRKRCIWDTKKRRCKKKMKKEDTVTKLNSESNTRNIVSKLNSELNAEIFCDTCDESEAEVDETHTEFLNQTDIQEKENSSKINVNHDTKQNTIKDCRRIETPCNQLLKSSDSRHNTQLREETSCVIEKLNPKKSVKEHDLEADVPSTVIVPFKSNTSDLCLEMKDDNIDYLSDKACTGIENSKCYSASNKLNDKFFETRSPTASNGNEAKDGETSMEFFNQSVIQEKVNSSEINTNYDTSQNIIEDSRRIETSCNQLVKLSDARQNTQLRDEISCVMKKLKPKKNIKELDVQAGVPSIIIVPSRADILSDSCLEMNDDNVDYLSFKTCTGSQDSKCDSASNRLNDKSFETRSSTITDGSKAEHDKTHLEFSKQNDIQERENSSELIINHDTNQNFIKSSRRLETSRNQLLKLNDESQNTQLREENSHVKEKLDQKKNVKEQDMGAEVPSAEIILSKKAISFNLCSEMKDINVDYLSVKACTGSQDPKCYSTSNISNDKSFETGSPTNIEPIILGLTEDELDFELDQQDDLKNEDSSDSFTSVSKFSNLQHNSFKAVSNSVVQDHLCNFDFNINTIDSSMNSEENQFSSSNTLQKIFSNFQTPDTYSSYDDDSDSDKDCCYKRSHERTSSIQEPLEDANAFEKTSTNLPAQGNESCEPLTRNVDENNLSLFASSQSTCDIENNVALSSIDSTKVSSKASLSLRDVVARIKECCHKEMGIEAVKVAYTYISINSTSYANRVLFKNLLLGLFSFVVNLIKDEASVSNVFDDVLKLMHKFKIYDKK